MSLSDSQTRLVHAVGDIDDPPETEAERQQRKLRQKQFVKSSAKYICIQVTPRIVVMFEVLD